MVAKLGTMDDESVSIMCKVLRQAGGTGAGGHANAGMMVCTWVEMNLKLVVFYIKYQGRVSYNVQYMHVMLKAITDLYSRTRWRRRYWKT